MPYANKEDQKAQQRAYYLANKEKLKEQNKAWRDANADNQKAYREENSEKRAKQSKSWRETNSEKVKAYNRSDKEIERRAEYRRNNKEKIKASDIAYRETHIEEEQARRKKYNDENRDKKREGNRRYKSSAIGKLKAVEDQAKRRAQKISTCDNSITTEALLEMQQSTTHCPDCGTELLYDVKRAVHLDHIHPLARGGKHTIGNVRYTCATCNYKKGAKIMMDEIND